MRALYILVFLLLPTVTLQTSDSIEEDLSLWMNSGINAAPTIIPYPPPVAHPFPMDDEEEEEDFTTSNNNRKKQHLPPHSSSLTHHEEASHSSTTQQGRRAQAKASWDPKYDGYMDQRRPDPKDKYIYQGPLFDLDAAMNPLNRLKWFEGVRQGYVPDFLCPNDRFIRYWKSCPQDLTALAYWSTGYMPYIVKYTEEELEAIGLGGFEPSKFNSSNYFSCIRNCTHGLVYQSKIDVPYGFNRLCFIPDDDYAACPLKYAVCPIWSQFNPVTATCECQPPLTLPNLTSRTCRCPMGKFDNGTGICYDIECDRGQRLLGDDCIKACPYYADYNYANGLCVCRRSEKWISKPFNTTNSPYPWDMECIKEPDCPQNYFWDDPIKCSCPYITAPDGVCATSNECNVNGGVITNGTNTTCLWDTYATVASDSLRSSIADWIEYGIREDAGKKTYTYTLPSVPASGATIRVTIDATAVLKKDINDPAATILRGKDVPIRLSKVYLDLDNTARSGTVVITPVNNPLVTGDYIITLNHTVAVITGRDVRYSFVGGNNTTPIGSASFTLLDTSTSTIIIDPASWSRNDVLGTLMELSTAPNQTLTFSVTLGAAWSSPDEPSTSLLRLLMQPRNPNVTLIPSFLIFESDNVTEAQTVNVVWNTLIPPPTDVEFTIGFSTDSDIAVYQNVTATIYGITTTKRSPVLTRTSPNDVLTEGTNVSYTVTLDGRAPSAGSSVSVLIGYTVVGDISPEFSALISSSLSISPSLLSLGSAQLGRPQTITVSYPRDLTYTGEWSIVLTHTVSVSDPLFSQLALPDILLSVSEVDSTTLIVSSNQVYVNESKAAEFTVSLSSRPLVSVTLSFTVDGPTDAYRNISSLSIDRNSWSSARTVRIETTDNDFASDERTLIVTADVTGYGIAVSLPPVSIIILDDDLTKVGIIVVPKPYTSINASIKASYTETKRIQLTETRSIDMARDWRGVVDYATAPWASSFTVALGTQPLQDLRITVDTDKQTQIAFRSGRISPYNLMDSRVLTFTATDWNIPQVVYIAAYDDDIDETRIISNTAEQSHSGSISVSVLPPTVEDNVPLSRENWLDIAYLNASTVIVPASILDNDIVGIEIGYEYMFFTDIDNGGIITYNTTWEILDTPALYTGVNVGESDMAGGSATSLYFPGRTVRPAVSTSAAYAIRLKSQPYSFTGTGSNASTLDPRSPPFAEIGLSIQKSFKMCAFTDGRYPETITLCTTNSNCSSLRNLLTERDEVGVCIDGPTVNIVSPSNSIVKFSSSNWNQWIWVQVNTTNNFIDETGLFSDFLPSRLSHTVVTGSVGTDTSYANVQAVANVNIFDDDVSNIRLYSENGVHVESTVSYQLTLTEGSTDKYALSLSTQPRTSITVVRADLGTSGNAALQFAPVSLQFNSSNWNIPQYFTVTALQNYIDEGRDSNFTVLHELIIPSNANDVDVFYRSLSRSQLPRVPLTITNDDTAGVLVVPVVAPGTTSADKLNTGSVTHILYSLTSQPTLPVEIRVSSFLDGTLTSLCAPAADPGASLTIFSTEGEIVSSYTSTLRDTIRLVFDASSWSIPQGIGLVLSSTVAANKVNVSLTPTIRFPSGTESVYSRLSTRNLTFTRLIESTPAYRVNEISGRSVRVEESASNIVTTVGFTTTIGSSLNAVSTVYVYAPPGHCIVRGVPIPSLFCRVNNDCTVYSSESTCLLNTKVTVTPSTLTMTSQTASGGGTFTNASFDIVAQDDPLDEGSPHHALLLFLTGGSDPAVDTVIGSASVLIADNDGAGIRTVPNIVNISESDSTSNTSVTNFPSTVSYSITLRTPPTGSVTVTPRSLAATPVSGTLLSFSPTSVTFTSSTFDIPQNITITVPRDFVRRGVNQFYSTRATHALVSTDPKYSGTALRSTDISCTIGDMDTASLVVEVISDTGSGNNYNSVVSYRTLSISETVSILEGTPSTKMPILYLSLSSIPSTGTIVVRLSANIAIFPSVTNDITTYAFTRDIIFDTSSWSTRTPVNLGILNDAIDRGIRFTSIRIAPLSTATNLLNTEYATTSVTFTSSIIDDDIASLVIASTVPGTVSRMPTAFNMSEGKNISFTVAISSVPADGTTVIASINVTSAVNSRSTLLLDPGSAVLAVPAVLTWTPATANRTYSITLLANDNNEADGNVNGILSIGLSSRTTDPVYSSKNQNGQMNSTVTNIQVLDDDVQGVLSTISSMELIKPLTNTTTTSTSSTGSAQTVGLRLGARPSGSSTITVTPRVIRVNDKDVTSSNIVSFSRSSITFDSSTWSTSTDIRITAIGTPEAPTPAMQTLVISFDSSDPAWASVTLTVRVYEAVGAGFTLSNMPSTLAEGSETNLRVMMTTEPSTELSYVARIVKGSMVQSDVQVKSGFTRGRFNSSSWQVPVTIPIVFTEDNFAGLQESVTLCLAVTSNMTLYNDRDYCLPLRLLDNDNAGYTITILSGANITDTTTSSGTLARTYSFTEGLGAILSIKLTSVPRAQVSLTISSDNGALVPFSPATLTFTSATTDGILTLVKITDDNVLNAVRQGSFRISATALNSAGSTENGGVFDTAYSSISQPHLYSIVDDDASRAALTLTLSPEALIAKGVMAEGTSVTATLGISVAPGMGMTVPIRFDILPNFNGIVQISPSSYVFNRTVFQPVTVTITAVRDFVLSDTNTQRISVISAVSTTSAVTAYVGAVANASVTITEVDTIGWVSRPGRAVALPGAVSVVAPVLFIAEGVGFSTYTLTLSSLPSSSVPVAILYTRLTTDTTSASDTGLIISVFSNARSTLPLAGTYSGTSSSPVTVTFDRDNWAAGFVINVSAPADTIIEGRIRYEINHYINAAASTPAVEYSTLSSFKQIVSVTDSGLAVSASVLRLTEESRWTTNTTYTLKLMVPPTTAQIVTISVSPADSRVVISPTTVTFEPNGITSVPVTVSIVNDFFADPDRTVSISHQSSEDTVTVDLTIVDDDVPSLVVLTPITPNRDSLVNRIARIDEGSINVPAFALRLGSRPSADVNVSFTEIFPSSSVQPLLRTISTVTIRANAWNTPINISLSAARDFRATPDRTTSIVMSVSSTDSSYLSVRLVVPPVTVTLTNLDTAGIILAGADRKSVVEGAVGLARGAADTFTMRLSSIPSGTVVINIRPGSRLTTSPSLVQFTEETWSVPVTVSMSAVNDDNDEGLHTELITLRVDTVATLDSSYTSIVLPSVLVSITDDDFSALVKSTTAIVVGEDAATPSNGPGVTTVVYSLSLATQPYFIFGATNSETKVTVRLDLYDGYCSLRLTNEPNHATMCSTDSDCAAGFRCTKGGRYTVTPTELSFTNNDWSFPQRITVTAIDDNIVEPQTVLSRITHTMTSLTDSRYNNLGGGDISVTVWDNDAVGIRVGYTTTTGIARVFVNEDSSASTAFGSFTVRLASQPWSTVTIRPWFDPVQVRLAPNQAPSIDITPENWNVPVPIFLGAIDDLIDEPKPHISLLGYNVSSLDTAYRPLSLSPLLPATSPLYSSIIRVSIMDNDWAGLRYQFRPRSANGNAVVRTTGTDVFFDDSACLNACSSPTSPCPSSLCTSFSGLTTNLILFEGGVGDNYTVSLTSRPLSPVAVYVGGVFSNMQGETVNDTCGDGRTGTPGNQLQVQTLPFTTTEEYFVAVLNFDANNWNIPQNVAVRATDDRVDEGGNQVIQLSSFLKSDDGNYFGSILRTASCTASQSVSDSTSHPGLVTAYDKAKVATSVVETNGCPRNPVDTVSATINEDAWAVPAKLSNAVFSDDLTSIIVTFTGTTDFGGLTGSFNCNRILKVETAATIATKDIECRGQAYASEITTTEQLLGSGASCSWASNRRLVISFGANPTVVTGDQISIFGRNIRRSPTARIYSFGNVTVRAPASAIRPTADIGSPAVRVGQCVGASVSVSQAGSGNRPMTFAWSLVSAKDINGAVVDIATSTDLANVTAGLTEATTNKLSVLRFGPYDWPQGWTIVVEVTATNFVGLSGTNRVQLTKAATPVPIVLLPSSLSFLRSQIVFVEARSFAPRCPNEPERNASARAMSFYWFDVTNAGAPELETSDGNVFESIPLVAYGSAAAATAAAASIVHFPIPSLSTIPLRNNRTRVLSFPSRLLAPSQSFFFKVFAVMDVDPTAYAETTVRIDIVADPLVPSITGGLLVQRTIQQAFTLDASGSSDPAGIATDDITSYSWSCVPNFERNSILKTAANAAPTKCGSLLFTGVTSSSIQVPARSLTPEYYYDFTVVYTVGGENGRSASFTQTVQMVFMAGPSFQVEAPVTYFNVAPGTERLTLRSTFGPAEDMTKLSMVWSQVSGPPVPAIAFLDESVRPSYFATQVTRESLVILPNILNPNADYSFCLTAASSGGLSTPATSCTSFRTASVPSGGSLTVTAVGDGSAFTPYRFTISNVGGEISAFDLYYITDTQLPVGTIRDGFATRSSALASWLYVNGRTIGKRFDHRNANDVVFERSVLPEGKLVIIAAPTTRYTTYGILWTTVDVSPFTGTLSELLSATSNAAGDGDYLQTGSSVAATASIVSTAGGRLRRLLSSTTNDAATTTTPIVRRLPPSLFHGRILPSSSSTDARSLAGTVTPADAAALLKLAAVALAQARNALTASGLIDQISVLRSISTLPDAAMDMNNSNTCIDQLRGIIQVSSEKNIATPLNGLTDAIGIISDCIIGHGAEDILATVRAEISNQLVPGAASDIAKGKSFYGQFAKSTLANLNSLNVHVGSDLTAQFGSEYISFQGASLPQDALTIQVFKLTDSPAAAELGSSGAATFVVPPIEATLIVASTNTDAHPAPVPHPRSGEILPVLKMTYYVDGACMDIPGMRYDGRFYSDGEWIRNGTAALAETVIRNGVPICQATLYTYHLSQFALVAAPSSRLQVKDTNGALLTPLSSPIIVDENTNTPQNKVNLRVLLESAPVYPVTVTLATPPGVCYDTVAGSFVRKVVNGVPTNARVTCDPVTSPCSTGICFQLLASISPSTIVFEPSKWQTAITVTLSAPTDYYYEGGVAVTSTLYLEPLSSDDRFDVDGVCVEANADGVCTLRSNNPGLLLPVSVKDSLDTAGFTLSGASTYIANPINESDTSPKSYTVKLASKPFSSVTVNYLSNDLSVLGSRGRISFTPSNYDTPQAVVFSPIDDVIAQGTHTGAIVHTVTATDTAYQSQSIADVTITLLDNDVATIRVSPLSKTTIEETGVSGPILFTLSITSRPASAVTVHFNTTVLTAGITYTSSYPYRFMVDGKIIPSYTFTENNWDTSAIISLVGIRDGQKMGDVDIKLFFTVQTDDPVYTSLQLSPTFDTEFKVKDADNARFSLRQGVPLISAGGTASYSIRLSALPTSLVRLYPSVRNPNTNPSYPQPLSVSPAMVEFDAATFDQWQTITVTATASDIAFPNKTYTITHNVQTGDTEYANLESPAISFELTQALAPLILIRPSRINITEGAANGTGQVLVFTNGGKSSYTSIPLGITLLSQPVTTNTLFFSFIRRDMYGPIQLPGSSSLLSPYITLDANTYSTGVPASLTAQNDCIAWNSGTYVGTVTVVNGDPNYVGLSAPFTIQYIDNDIQKVGMDVVAATSPIQVPIYTSSTGFILRVTLRTQPWSTVIVSVTSGSSRVRVSNTTVIFYPSEFKCSNGIVTSPVKEIILTQSLPQFDSNNAPIPRSSGSTMITFVASGGGDTFYQGQSAFIGVGFAGDPAASMSQTPTPTPTSSVTSTRTETATGTSTASYGTSPSRTPSNTRTPSATRSPVSPTSTATFGSSASPSTVPARSLIALALDGVNTIIFSISVPIQTALKTSITATLPLVRLPIEMLQITEIKRTDEVDGAGLNGARVLSGTNNSTQPSTVVYLTVLFNNLGAAKELYADVGSANFPDDLADMLMLLDSDQGLGGVYSQVSIRVIGNAIVLEPAPSTEITPEQEPLLSTNATLGVAIGVSGFVIVALLIGYTVRSKVQERRKEKLKDIHKLVDQGTQLSDDTDSIVLQRTNNLDGGSDGGSSGVKRHQKMGTDENVDVGVGNDDIYGNMDGFTSSKINNYANINQPTSPSYLRTNPPQKTPLRSPITVDTTTPRSRNHLFNITSSGKKSSRSLSTDNSKLVSPSSLYGDDDEEFEVISPRMGLRARTIQPTLRSRRISKGASSNIMPQLDSAVADNKDIRSLNNPQLALTDNTVMGTLDFKLPAVPPPPPMYATTTSSRARILTSIPSRSNYRTARYDGSSTSTHSSSDDDRRSMSSHVSGKSPRRNESIPRSTGSGGSNASTSISNAIIRLPTVSKPVTSTTKSTTRPSVSNNLLSGKGLEVKPIAVPDDIDSNDTFNDANLRANTERNRNILDIDSPLEERKLTFASPTVTNPPIASPGNNPTMSALPPHKRTPGASMPSPTTTTFKRGSLPATLNSGGSVARSPETTSPRQATRPISAQPGLLHRKKVLLTRIPAQKDPRSSSSSSSSSSSDTASYSTDSSVSGDDYNSIQVASRTSTTSPPASRASIGNNNPFSVLTGNNNTGTGTNNKLHLSLNTYRSSQIISPFSSIGVAKPQTNVGNLASSSVPRISIQVGNSNSPSTASRVSATIDGTGKKGSNRSTNNGVTVSPARKGTRTKPSPVRIE